MINPLAPLAKGAPPSITALVGTLVIGVLFGGGVVWLNDTAVRVNDNDLTTRVDGLTIERNRLKGELETLTNNQSNLVPRAEFDRVNKALSDVEASLRDLKTPVYTYQTVDNKWCPWIDTTLCFEPHLVTEMEAGANPHYGSLVPSPLAVSIPHVWERQVQFSQSHNYEQFFWNGKAYVLVIDLRPFYDDNSSTRFGMCVDQMPEGGVIKSDDMYKCFPRSGY